MIRHSRTKLARCLRLIAGIVCLAPCLASAQSVFTHASLRVPSEHQAEAAEWYNEVLGGTPGEIGPGPDTSLQ